MLLSSSAHNIHNQEDDNSDLESTTTSQTSTFLHPQPQQLSSRSLGLDKRFFKPTANTTNNNSTNTDNQGQGHYTTRPFNYKYSEQGRVELESGKLLSGRKQRAMIAMERGVDPSEVRLASGAGSKKHFKGGKRVKKGKANRDGAED